MANGESISDMVDVEAGVVPVSPCQMLELHIKIGSWYLHELKRGSVVPALAHFQGLRPGTGQRTALDF